MNPNTNNWCGDKVIQDMQYRYLFKYIAFNEKGMLNFYLLMPHNPNSLALLGGRASPIYSCPPFFVQRTTKTDFC